MSPLNQIASIAQEGDGVRIVTTPGANDPMLLLRSQWLVAPPRWNSWQFVTSWSLAWIAAAAFALVAVAAGLVFRELRPIDARHSLWLAALLLTVVAAKLTLLRHYPMPVPL